MHIMQSRRDFLTSLSAAGTASVFGTGTSFAGEAPPEVATIRLHRDPSICVAPWYIAEDLLRAEGFTDIRYVPVQSGPPEDQLLASGGIDFSLYLPATLLRRWEEGLPITALTGLHSGCFELFAHEPIRTISDLKGKRVGIDFLGTAKHLYVTIMAANIGLDPKRTSNGWRNPTVTRWSCLPKARSMPFSVSRPSPRSCEPGRSVT
jgi:NitT/TauT family transport system substrate-binding protein